MFDNLSEVEINFEETTRKLTDPAVISNNEEYKKLMKLRSRLEPVVTEYRLHRSLQERIREARELLASDDQELREMARADLDEAETLLEQSLQDLKILMLPKDPNDDKDIIVEIRAGAGGDEAGLFAGDLFRAYSRYAERMGWRTQLISKSETGVGGFKEIIFSIAGSSEDGVYSRLKFESGVHRVQRVPTTEAQGRIHTSTITVAILAEVEDVEIEVKEEDLRVDRFCASGHGGQSVNTTQSAIRITHLPTGLVVTCQDEKSQHKNKAAALKVLKARLYDQESQKQMSEIADNRKSQVGTGDRSERIRTYNFPQGRVTDHRIGLTLYKLLYIMDGDLDEIIDALIASDQAAKLRAISS
ncbi:MAG: peptide chain release factor 1 [Candidatus Wallbacteria bacterium HGW-Wallbacteria-1]|uniref:Peptide chain release factor 1 n=1 Tax=Candidatus Wallbacteria bacterium HGW-Wallbacteria-1 TaxID=2013854 RepID=A0A2N1PVI3_9BACT|nr:MAG: peptide chain release factor 1 [Candidatus Wallbacteria bacterium HGW-Wallbacteria-1]